MTTSTLSPARSVSAAARTRIAEHLGSALMNWDGQRSLRVEVTVPVVDPLAWLRAQSLPFHTYWCGRGENEARAAVGSAAVIDAASFQEIPEGLQPVLDSLPGGARMYGTSRFAVDVPSSNEWAPFGQIRFVLPRLELRTDGRTAALAVNVAPGESPTDVLDEFALHAWPTADSDTSAAIPVSRTDKPARHQWDVMLRWAFDAFRDGSLDKVVLARRVTFGFEEEVDPYRLLALLQDATPRCFHTLLSPEPGTAFVGASPERLFRLEGRRLQTEAVAGTRPRADLDADDDRLRDELLASDKDQREHEFVRRAITERLADLATDIDADVNVSAMTLARGRHLYTGIRATLNDGVSALDVLRELHPTPAVGGTPRYAAMDAIESLEPFDRGLYAGPIGWIGRTADGSEEAEFAVGIRCGLVRENKLGLYSGAGIVEGSTADAEWAEIEHKIGDFARLLGLDVPLGT